MMTTLELLSLASLEMERLDEFRRTLGDEIYANHAMTHTETAATLPPRYDASIVKGESREIARLLGIPWDC